jgi:ketosteroid isomerase-like protein
MSEQTIHPRVERLQRGMAAFGQGDADTMKSMMSPDIVWHVPGDNPLAGDYHGPDAVVEMLGESQRRSGGQVEPIDVLVGAEFLVSFTRFTNDDGFDVMFADALRYDDDQIVEYWSLASDQAAWDALLH